MTQSRLPWPGFAIAFAGTLVFAISTGSWVAAGGLLLLWAGTLYLSSAAPPEARNANGVEPLLRDTMGELVEHSHFPVLVTDQERVIVANLAARRILGSHVLGQDVRMALRQPEAVSLVGRDSDGTATVRNLARRRDIWRISRKSLPGQISVYEFVNRTAEEDISRAHTDFVANASHELRTPLASIIGYVETLQDGGDTIDPATRIRFLDTIAREARRLKSLVDDLMSLSRIEAEKHDLPDTTVDLSALVERAARDGAGNERLDRLDFASDGDFTVRGDAQQLEQLVRNLVDNGLKYGSVDGVVTVRVAQRGEDRVTIAVSDQGDGIPAEHLPHLTRRFYRTDPGRSRAAGGTGLGLAIVKHIVERHRGSIDIVSEPGAGTTVTIVLPAPH